MSDNVHEHPELKAEQAHVDHAHACLDAARERALHLTRMVEVGQGGTNQARFEREAIIDSVAARLDHLDLGDASLVFGRIDQEAEAGAKLHSVTVMEDDPDEMGRILESLVG